VVGTTASTITVTALDQFGNPINGASVNPIAASGTGNTLSTTFGSTNSSGVLTTTINSTKAEGKTVSAVVNGVTITQTAGVTVVHDVVSAATSLVAATGPITASSGSSLSSVTITLLDQFSNPVSGLQDTIWVGGNTGANTITAQPGLSDVNGQSFGSFSRTTAGSWNVFAFINSISSFTSNFATVTVNAAAAASIAVNLGNNQTVRVNTAVPTLPSVIVKDAFGNVKSGVTVTFAVATGGGSGTGLSTSTAGTGIATVGSWTVQAAVAASGTGTHSNTMTATAAGFAGGGNPVTFTAQGIYTLSGDAQPIFTASCVGCHGGGGNQPNLTAGTTHSTTVGVAALCVSGTRIVAGSASTSVLFLRMQGGSCGVMPPGGVISVANQNIVRDWINNGAQAN
jgi:adhesin/invasin